MREWGMVESDTRPEGVQITELKVFTNTDIEEIEVYSEDGEKKRGFRFTQTEYEKDEYIALLNEQVQEVQDGMVELADLIVG